MSLSLYVAGALKEIKADAMQQRADLEMLGHPNYFPSVPVATCSDWDHLQLMDPETLRYCVNRSGNSDPWDRAVLEVTGDGTSMHDLLRRLRCNTIKVSPRNNAISILMPTQEFLRQVKRRHADDEQRVEEVQRFATAYEMLFIDGEVASFEGTLGAMLDTYECFHVLEALPVKWSPEHLFKCNCTVGMYSASCWHSLMAGMVCDSKISVPTQYLRSTFQARRKRGRPSKGGETDPGAPEGDARTKLAFGGGYQVPQVC